jgi:hypothetical protein
VNLATAILIPLIAGYAFSLTWDGSRYFAAREEGYRLYFRTALYGVVLFLAAALIHLYIISHFDGYLPYLKNVLSAFINEQSKIKDDQITLISLALITLLLGLFLGHTLNTLPYSKKILLFAATSNDDFEQLVIRSVRKSLPICVTMSNKKVYVGYAIRTIDPGDKRTALRILPLISGYRTEEGLINFNVSYHDVYEKISPPNEDDEADEDLSHLEISDFEKVLPYDEIQSSHLFDLAAYVRFQAQPQVDMLAKD